MELAAVVNISGRRDHAIVEHAKQVLLNLMHRGAAGADESTGDGAGILLQIPHGYFRAVADGVGIPASCPKTATGWRCCSCPAEEELRRRCQEIFADAGR